MMSEFPLALDPIYRTPTINQPIALYNGPVTLEQTNAKQDLACTVHYDWLPSPMIRFTTGSVQPGVFRLEECMVTFPEAGPKIDAFISQSPTSYEKGMLSHSLSGWPNDTIVFNQGKESANVVFHLTNFLDYRGFPISDRDSRSSWIGRLVLEADIWRITLDWLGNIKDLLAGLKAQGGFAITHVGRLERQDGNGFTKANADPVWPLLFNFLSFVRGFWVAPILPVGLDASGGRVWEEWLAWRSSPWTSVDSWFCPHYPEGIIATFPGFVNRWQDPDWQHVTQLAIYWYMASNQQQGGVEGSIVLAQTALELLSWALLAETKGLYTRSQFDKMNAADKIGRLLSECSIPVALDQNLKDLADLANRRGWADGPHSLVGLRNDIVHPEKKNRLKFQAVSSSEFFDAWKLALRYIELVLLNLFGYVGPCANRLKHHRWRGDVEAVPWASPNP